MESLESCGDDQNRMILDLKPRTRSNAARIDFSLLFVKNWKCNAWETSHHTGTYLKSSEEESQLQREKTTPKAYSSGSSENRLIESVNKN